MGCAQHQNCGGCVFRDLPLELYQKQKAETVRQMLEQKLGDLTNIWQPPVFLKDGLRRRAAFAFHFQNQRLVFGFNAGKSNQIVDIETCLMIKPEINRLIPVFRALLTSLCAVQTPKLKSKKRYKTQITQGDFLVLEADNGIDVVLETDVELCLDHRLMICDFMGQNGEIIRFSWRKKHCAWAEPIVQKAKPFIKIGKTNVLISSGDFLQASKEGEQALMDLVLSCVGQTRGKISDLFCGVGTFSYGLAELENTHITAVDVSASLLGGLKKTINAEMIQNISLQEKNLFLYPLTADELSNFDVVVFDPPRAGALETVRELSKIEPQKRPEKIVAVSCFPLTFARDAKVLIDAGYVLKSITLLDQFVYSNHSELVALFTNEK